MLARILTKFTVPSTTALKLITFSLVICFSICYFLLPVPTTQAANGINQIINFQGKVANNNGTNVTDGAYDFVFKIYNGASSGSSTLFTENWTSAALFSSTMSSAPSSGGESLTYSSNTNESTLKVGQILWNTTKKESVKITSVNTSTNVIGISATRQAWATGDTVTNRIYVKDGLFTVAINSLNQNIAGVDFNSDSIYLGINYNSDGEMKPRIQFSSVPYAFNSQKVNGVTVTNSAGGTPTTGTTIKIADGKTVAFEGGLTFAGTDGKTLTVNNTITFGGTDGTSFTLPSSSDTLVGLAATQTLTNKSIGESGLNFANSNSVADITTNTDQDFIIIPGGDGFVGIGGANPSHMLDVVGEIATWGTDGAGGAILLGSNDSPWWWIDNDDDGILRFSSSASPSDTGAFVMTNTGRFGIGTATPEAELEVRGAVLIQGEADLNTDDLTISRPGALSSSNVMLTLSQRSNNTSFNLYGYDGTTFKTFAIFNYDDHSVSIGDGALVAYGATGNTTATNGLEIHKTAAPTTTAIAGSYLHLGGEEYDTDSYRLITFGYRDGGDSYAPAYMGYQSTDNGSFEKGALVFGTRDVITDTAATERMRIATNGNLGIGSTNPERVLHVLGDQTDGVALLERSNASTNTAPSVLMLKGTTSADMVDGFGTGLTFFIEDSAAVENKIGGLGFLRSGADNSGAMAAITYSAGVQTGFLGMMPNGNVSIGDLAPSGRLTVTASLDGLTAGATNQHLVLRNMNNTNGIGPGIAFSTSTSATEVGAKIVFARTGSNSMGDLVFYTKSTTSSGDTTTEKMRINANGNVGIGVSAGTKLDVNGLIRVRNPQGDTTAPTLANNGEFAFANVSSTNRLYFYMNSTRNYINASGAGDYSEYFKKTYPAEILTPGMVIGTENGQVTKALRNSVALGVVSAYGTKGFDSTGDRGTDTSYTNVGLLGQLPVIVSNEQGPIQSGDPLGTNSLYAGVSSKLSTTDIASVGHAQQGFNPNPASCQNAASLADINWPVIEENQQPDNQLCFKLANDIVVGKVMAYIRPASNGLTSPTSTISEGAQLAIQQLSADAQGLATTGNLTVNGDLSVAGALSVNGPAEFKGPAIFRAIAEFFNTVIFHNNVSIEGKLALNKDTAGITSIQPGQSSVHITFNQPYTGTPVTNANLVANQLTQEQYQQLGQSGQCQSTGSATLQDCQQQLEQQLLDDNIKYIISDRTAQGFTIKLDQPAAQQLYFSWTAFAQITE